MSNDKSGPVLTSLNYNGMEIGLSTELGIPAEQDNLPIPAATNTQNGLFILMVIAGGPLMIKGGYIKVPKPKPIIFDSLDKLRAYVMHEVIERSHGLEERFSKPLKEYAGKNQWSLFFQLWRYSQLNDGHIGFDAYWDETPHKVL